MGEDHPQKPQSPYGWGKFFVERTLEAFERGYGLRFAALRYFNAAGATAARGEDHDPETHLIPLALRSAMGPGDPVTVFGRDYPTPDGTCVRDYVHVADLAQAHLLALDRLAGGGESLCLNLGTGQGHSVLEVLEAARRVTGRPVPTRDGLRRPGDSSRLVADAGRARAVLGWVPQFQDLEAIVASAYRWHSSHPAGYGDRRG